MPPSKSCHLLQWGSSFHTLFSKDPRDGVGLALGFTVSFKPLFFLSLQNKAHAPVAGIGCLYPSESSLTPPIRYPRSLDACDLVKLPFHAAPSLTLPSPPSISTSSPFRLPLQAQPRASPPAGGPAQHGGSSRAHWDSGQRAQVPREPWLRVGSWSLGHPPVGIGSVRP